MAVRYRDEGLEPIVRLYRLYAAAVGPTFVLMDDNACPHRAAIVDDYLENEGIARMEWPGYSLDLNPTENLWDSRGRAVSSRFPPPAPLIELKTAVQKEWQLLSFAMVGHLIESIVTRSKLCIQVSGAHIPYFLKLMSFYCFMMRIFTLYIILFLSPVCHYLITYKNVILFTLHLYIIIDFTLFTNIYATFRPNFV